VGRGTEKFQIYGSPYLPKVTLVLLLNQIWAHKILFIMEYFVMAKIYQTSRLNQLELKWLIKAFQTTNNKSKFFNPFSPNLQELKNYNSK
jgi:hypothetical protein